MEPVGIEGLYKYAQGQDRPLVCSRVASGDKAAVMMSLHGYNHGVFAPALEAQYQLMHIPWYPAWQAKSRELGQPQVGVFLE